MKARKVGEAHPRRPNVVDIAIEALGLGTQLELAERTGVTKQNVSAWFQRDRIPSVRLLMVLRNLRRERRKIPEILWVADLPRVLRRRELMRKGNGR